MLLHAGHRLGPVIGDVHPVAQPAQQSARDLLVHQIIFRHQDTQAAGHVRRVRRGARSRPFRPARADGWGTGGDGWQGMRDLAIGACGREQGDWQFEPEVASDAAFTFDPDPAVHQADEPPADRKAEARSAIAPGDAAIHLAEIAEEPR